MSEHVDILVPEVGAGAEPLRVSAWLVQPGDSVSPGERVCELLIPGITCDVICQTTGTLDEIVATTGTEVSTGSVLGRVRVEAS